MVRILVCLPVQVLTRDGANARRDNGVHRRFTHTVEACGLAGLLVWFVASQWQLTEPWSVWFGVVAFTESLRQEALHIGVRASVVEPGMVATELLDHNKNPVVLEAAAKMQEQIGDPLQSEDIARAIVYIVGQPPHVAVNEMLVRPARQQR